MDTTIIKQQSIYVVSDVRRGTYPDYRPYWRVTGIFPSIIWAKKWADPVSSIITEHDADEEIKVGWELPSTVKVVG